jgi:hypothetical protein
MWRSIPFVTGAQLRTVLDMGPEDEFLGWVNIGHVASDEHAATRPGIDLTPIELGLTILLITHEVRVARRLADTTAVMRAGRIVEVGRTASVLTTPRDPYTRALLDAVLPAQPRQVSVQQ